VGQQWVKDLLNRLLGDSPIFLPIGYYRTEADKLSLASRIQQMLDWSWLKYLAKYLGYTQFEYQSIKIKNHIVHMKIFEFRLLFPHLLIS